MSIKDKCYIYHLTSLDNVEGILEKGILPRSELSNFVDIADSEIISKREVAGLEDKVPFHFFAKNPFDGAVQKHNPDKSFVLFAVKRELARKKDWSIIPEHPLSKNTPQLLSYDEGIEAIDWESMDFRDYFDPYIHSVCLAECLSPSTVQMKNVDAIYVKTENDEKVVRELLSKFKLNINVYCSPNMFVG